MKKLITICAVATMILAAVPASATVVPIGSTEMTFSGDIYVVVLPNPDPDEVKATVLRTTGTLTLTDPVDPGITLDIYTIVDEHPLWQMWQDGSTLIGEGTVDNFDFAGVSGDATATYKGTGSYIGFSEVGTWSGTVERTGPVDPGLQSVMWSGDIVMTPEPATLCLLGLGGLGVLIRRRRKA